MAPAFHGALIQGWDIGEGDKGGRGDEDEGEDGDEGDGGGRGDEDEGEDGDEGDGGGRQCAGQQIIIQRQLL